MSDILRHIVCEHIQKKGEPIAFSEFMGLALYHPKYGYYSAADTSKDYFTSVDVNPIFGRLLAEYFIKVFQEKFSDVSKKIHLVELGCGKGKLAHSVLSHLQEQKPELFKIIQYYGIEISPFRRLAAEETLKDFADHVTIEKNFGFDKHTLRGIVYSNEFFDALPFDRVINKHNSLYDICVNENLEEEFVPASKETTQYLAWLGACPPNNCQGEIHSACKNWIEKITQAMKRGVILTVDYGHPSTELYSEIRPQGTAACFFQNTLSEKFYENLGRQDITAHVNFSALQKAGEDCGLKNLSLQTQSNFLLDHGLEHIVQSVQAKTNPRDHLKISSAIKTLIHPEGLGGTFKVLLQEKCLPNAPTDRFLQT